MVNAIGIHSFSSSWIRDRIPRINIYSRFRRMTGRTREAHWHTSAKFYRSRGPCIFVDISPESKKGTARTSATYRRCGTWRQYLSISILMVPFSDFEKRSNALPCQVVGLRDACWGKTVTSCSRVVENSRTFRTIRLYFVRNSVFNTYIF